MACYTRGPRGGTRAYSLDWPRCQAGRAGPSQLSICLMGAGPSEALAERWQRNNQPQ